MNGTGIMGKVTLRLTDDLHRQVRILAAEERVTMNTWIVRAVSEKIGGSDRLTLEQLHERVERLEAIIGMVAHGAP